MSNTIPAWARAVLLLDRAVLSTVRLAALFRSELLLAGLSPEARAAVNAEVFSAEDTYAPGGPTFSRGLFAWERAALEHPRFPPSGRVLLGGAGGGRELSGLSARGYAVVAFEPAEGLYTALSEVARGASGAQALRGDYADLVRAVGGAEGPFSPLIGTRFDAVVLGWASLSHVTHGPDRVALLRALRALAPDAPVLLSYLGPDDDGRANGRVEALREPLRRWLGRVFGGPAVEPGEGFVPGAGFYQRFTQTEIAGLAESAGYSVVFHVEEPYPHALLAAFVDSARGL